MARDIAQALLDDAINTERVFVVRYPIGAGIGIYYDAGSSLPLDLPGRHEIRHGRSQTLLFQGRQTHTLQHAAQ